MPSLRNTATIMLGVLSLAAAAHAEGWTVPKPTAGLMPNPAQGKRLFEKNCASCHGSALEGTKQGPPFLNRIYRPAHHSDISFQLAVANGARAHHWQFGDMKPVPGMSPNDVAHVTAYVRMMQRRAGIE